VCLDNAFVLIEGHPPEAAATGYDVVTGGIDLATMSSGQSTLEKAVTLTDAIKTGADLVNGAQKAQEPPPSDSDGRSRMQRCSDTDGHAC